MLLLDFPNELLFMASGHLEVKDLTRLMRTCRTFQALLTPIVLSHITENATTILFTGIRLRSLPIVTLALSHGAAWHTGGTGYGNCLNGLLLVVEEGTIPIMSALLAHFGPAIAADTGASQYRNLQSGGEDQDEEDEGHDWDYEDKWCHSTPFELALEQQNFPMAKFLLESGVWTNATCFEPDLIAWDIVATEGTAEMARLILKHGARLEAPKLLWTACQSMNWPVVEVLIRKGISIPSEMHWWNGHATGKRRSKEAREFVRMAKKQNFFDESESD